MLIEEGKSEGDSLLAGCYIEEASSVNLGEDGRAGEVERKVLVSEEEAEDHGVVGGAFLGVEVVVVGLTPEVEDGRGVELLESFDELVKGALGNLDLVGLETDSGENILGFRQSGASEVEALERENPGV